MKIKTIEKETPIKVSTPAEINQILVPEIEGYKRKNDQLKLKINKLQKEIRELKAKQTIEIPIEPIKAMLNSFKSKWKYKRINPKTNKPWYPNCDAIVDVIENFLKKSVK